MKKALTLILCFCLLSAAAGCSEARPSADEKAEEASAESAVAADTKGEVSPDLRVLTEAKTAQAFTDDAVSDEDIETILKAGINAPSGMNSQPWHFTAVTDTALLSEIAEAMSANRPAGANTSVAKADIGSAPLAIIISQTEGNDLNSGLACENMSIAAGLLGYGTKILASPCSLINSDYKEALSIPADMNCVAVLIIGTVDNSLSADEVTAPTERSPFDEVVSYVK